MRIESFKALQNYIESQDYKGFDPYDGLKSPLFKLPLFKSNKTIRFAFQQLVKRLPFNVRPLFFIKKGKNPVTLGLCIQAYAYLFQNNIISIDVCKEKTNFLLKELELLIPPEFSGTCWGYDFDWEARYAKILAYKPTIVATGIVTNALFVSWRITGNEHCLDLVLKSKDFILKDINTTTLNNTICFSYSPFDQQCVFNASMKGVRLLSQIYSETKDTKVLELASKAVEYVINHQNKDGSWAYSTSSSGTWIDNYHTGYILDCLHEYIALTGETKYLENLNKGYEFYKNHFVSEKGIPSFYAKKVFPIDCTAAGQTILTLIRFGDFQLAEKVALWTIEKMQSKKGYFYFRKYKYYTEKTSFMRWSNAWMFAALANSFYSFNKIK